MAISIKNLSQEKLKESLMYDHLTGIFTRKKYGRIGKNAGGLDTYGYVHIGVNGKQYKAHQLAWLYYYGEIPNGQIDHINCNRQDNRIENLRVVSSTINALNRSVAKGVYKHQSKYRARIKLNGKHLHLGLFDSEDLAKKAYLTAKKQYLGKFYGDY
jgi:hypothetical protein